MNEVKLTKINIIIGFITKGISLLIGLALVPISIEILGVEDYGYWITISALVSWLYIFDFGLSQGLRNKLVEAINNNDSILEKKLITSNYIAISIISLVLIMVLLPMIELTSVNEYFQKETNIHSNKIIITLLVGFLLLFMLKPIDAIFQSRNWTCVPSVIMTLSSLGILLCLMLVRNKQYSFDLFTYAIIFTLIPLALYLIVSALSYSTVYKLIRPDPKYYVWSKVKSTGKLGLSFFLVQISVVVLFQSDTLLINLFFGSSEVTSYNVLYRYYSIPITAVAVVLSPYWTRYNYAYLNRNFHWMKRTLINLTLLVVLISFTSLALYLCSEELIKLWIGSNQGIDRSMNFQLFVYTVLLSFSTMFATVSNGCGTIRVQMIINICCSFVNIPLSYFISVVLGYGTSGVLLATNICIVLIVVSLGIQAIKLSSNQAEGIWKS